MKAAALQGIPNAGCCGGLGVRWWGWWRRHTLAPKYIPSRGLRNSSQKNAVTSPERVKGARGGVSAVAWAGDGCSGTGADRRRWGGAGGGVGGVAALMTYHQPQK